MTTMAGWRPNSLGVKLAAAAALVALGEALFDASEPGAVVGGFALAWLAVLLAARRTIARVRAARTAALAALGFALVLTDDPSLLGWTAFWTTLSLAALLPRRGFDDAFGWARRLAWHGLTGIAAPLRDIARVARARERRRRGSVRTVAALLGLPLVGGAVFLALFAGANPLIGNALARIALPDGWTLLWRGGFAAVLLVTVWPSLRPAPRATAQARAAAGSTAPLFDPAVATLALSLLTFNAVFALQNVLDIAFLWSGAALPAGVTMAEYAHRGAYSLIVTALLAGGFVLVALRPGSAGAARPAVRRLVTVWIAQNVLLVASSILRTLDYVDAYGMTVLRLEALAWMGLVAAGLALIGWRLLRARSAAWLINANALCAAAVLAAASVIDLGASAAAWNVRVALAKGRAGPRLDLCHLGSLGESALVSLARLERRAGDAAIRDRIAYLRWHIQASTADRQADWRSWTWRNARRLAAAEALVGTRAPRLRPSPEGRECGGAIAAPPPHLEPVVAPTPPSSPLTAGRQR